jgi:hypothetical protein
MSDTQAATLHTSRQADKALQLLDGFTYSLGEGETALQRAIIVGDVHGCAVELEELLAACSYDSVHDLGVCSAVACYVCSAVAC